MQSVLNAKALEENNLQKYLSSTDITDEERARVMQLFARGDGSKILGDRNMLEAEQAHAVPSKSYLNESHMLLTNLVDKRKRFMECLVRGEMNEILNELETQEESNSSGHLNKTKQELLIEDNTLIDNDDAKTEKLNAERLKLIQDSYCKFLQLNKEQREAIEMLSYNEK